VASCESFAEVAIFAAETIGTLEWYCQQCIRRICGFAEPFRGAGVQNADLTITGRPAIILFQPLPTDANSNN
jgi:hypothetical protein